MKIRSGFVSNSSSSSFLVRGVLVGLDQLKLEFPEKTYECDITDGVEGALKDKNVKLEVHSNRYFFDGEPTGKIILGRDLGDMQDGEVREISDTELTKADTAIREELAKLGIKVEVLSTFIRYISNDNY